MDHKSQKRGADYCILLMITAKQKKRSDVLRAEYMIDMQVYEGHPEFFVFIDKSGADRRDSMCRFRYSLRGKLVRAQK